MNSIDEFVAVRDSRQRRKATGDVSLKNMSCAWRFLFSPSAPYFPASSFVDSVWWKAPRHELACLKFKVMESDVLGPKTLKPGQTDIFSFKLRSDILPPWKADWQTISTFHLSFGNKLNNLFSFLSYKIFFAYNYFSWIIVAICLFVFVF